LDVGCGGGILSEYLAAAGAIVTGIDVSEELIAVARLHALQTNTRIDYLCTSIEELSTTQHDRYDVVTCLELLEHVPDPEHMVRSCARQLNKDGELFFSTINRTSKAYALAVFGAEYLLKLLTREFRGLNYNPLSRQARLRDDLTVNYIAHFSAPQ
jgi:2-polyprenyl-6-hydroxyphenyl methylase/3-demethylubiquinone-9 3-methyltransferase